jgi:Transglutaminase-like superfamily
LLHIVARTARLGPRVWCDLARAACELVLANRKLAALTGAVELGLASPEAEQAASSQPMTQRQRRLIARVSFAVTQAGARMPFRSDCMVQALAARRWLAGAGIASALSIGVRKEGAPQFDAHAWLSAGGIVVTGGDVASYASFTAPAAACEDLQ